jgi:acyl carrier protein
LTSSHTAAAEVPSSEPLAADDRLVPLSDRISGLSDDDAKAFVLDHVVEKIAVVLGHSSSASIKPDEEFMRLGFDSMLSSELSKRLTASTGLKLRANAVLRYPTPRLITEHIASSLAKRGPQ